MTEMADKIHLYITKGKMLFKEEELGKMMTSVEKKLSTLRKLYRDLSFDDNWVFLGLSYTAYCRESKISIIADYLKLARDRIVISPEVEEILEMTSHIMCCESLATIFKAAQATLSVSLEEFIIGHMIVQDKGYILDIIADKVKDVTVLDEKVQSYIKKKKQGFSLLKEMN